MSTTALPGAAGRFLASYLPVAVVLGAPLLQGSNEARVWLGWTIVLALGFLATQGSGPRPDLRHALKRWPGIALVCAAPAMACLQLLPLWLAAPLPAPFPDTQSIAPGASAVAALRWAGYGFLFLIAVAAGAEPTRSRRISQTLFWGIVLHACLGLALLAILGDIALFGEKNAYLGFATGGFVGRGDFAAFCAMGLVLGTSLIGRGPSGRDISLSAGLALLMSALLASGARMALAAAIAGAGIALRGRVSARLALPLLAVILAAAATWPAMLERFMLAPSDLAMRGALWKQILGMIAQRPLGGFGLDAFAPGFEMFQRPPLSATVTWQHAHSTYLALWAELGVIAGSLVPIGLALIFWRLFGTARHSAACAAASGAIVLAGVEALTGSGFETTANTYLLTTILALGVARMPHEGDSAERKQR